MIIKKQTKQNKNKHKKTYINIPLGMSQFECIRDIHINKSIH